MGKYKTIEITLDSGLEVWAPDFTKVFEDTRYFTYNETLELSKYNGDAALFQQIAMVVDRELNQKERKVWGGLYQDDIAEVLEKIGELNKTDLKK